MNSYTGQSSKLQKLVILALLGTISMVLMFLKFPLPFLPPYLKVDVSDIPALLAAILFSPLAGIVVEALKNGLYMIFTGVSDPIGVGANFLAGVLFIVPVAVIYRRGKTMKSLLIGLIFGSVFMAVTMSVLNYFLILPAYSWFMGWETMSADVKWMTIVAGILPFNVIKGAIAGSLFIMLFVKMKDWIEQKTVRRQSAA
ncbi:ECF transporter S component [Halobacillus sp. HZG1]|uniref:ECF transporter S component n=1 Tax=Halobacillus sp. HZG1 TaxID=3111769 RepID=UPI002DC02535|nr:ECF transporter S component [Halobacillus sp. HZG1]MEC3882469.1 ECF transporter S component [Halobacillus sp. HZG1]